MTHDPLPQILPCPFCGDDACRLVRTNKISPSCHVFCDSCEAKGPRVSRGTHRGKAHLAIDRWNDREPFSRNSRPDSAGPASRHLPGSDEPSR